MQYPASYLIPNVEMYIVAEVLFLFWKIIEL